MAKIAYLVLTHGLPYQTMDFLWSIWREEDAYFVHVDRKSPLVAEAAIAAIAAAYPNIHTVPSDICTWGGFTLVEAEWRCLQTALSTDTAWSHAVLVSGTHVPLLRAHELADSLEPERSYLDFHSLVLDPAQVVPPKWWDTRAERLIHEYFEVPGIGVMRGPARTPPEDVTFYLGSQWWILSRAAAQSVCASRFGSLAEYFRSSAVPDESCIHTLLLNSPLKEQVVPREIVWQRWANGRPVCLGDNDLAGAFASKKLFARKASEAMMRDCTGTLARTVATADRRVWVKRAIEAFNQCLPAAMRDRAIERYRFGEPANSRPAKDDYVERVLLGEISNTIVRHAVDYGLKARFWRSTGDEGQTVLICGFPDSKTQAKFFLAARTCQREVAWVGLYLTAGDTEKAAEDLREFPNSKLIDFGFPHAGGLHPHHDVLELELKRKGVVWLNSPQAGRKLDSVIRTYLGIVARIPGMVDSKPAS